MIASLPWYHDPSTRAAEARLWTALQARLRMPDLSPPQDYLAHWRDPDLVLSQTCSLPWRSALFTRTSIVGAPDLRLPDCPAGHYFSHIVQRRDDPRGPEHWVTMDLAINDPLSQSGYAAPVAHAMFSGTEFHSHSETGSHAASIAAVAHGHCDIAGIDAHTWRLRARHDPNVAALRIVDRTVPTPAPPFITADATRTDDLRSALNEAIAAIGPEDRDTLGLYGLVDLGPDAYGPTLQSDAVSALLDPDPAEPAP